MQSDDGDPLDWTVDEVVEFLCRNPQTPWSQSASQAPRPDPVSFEIALRDNLITGEVLMHDVDKETLRDELGLKAIGHRSSMLMAIRYLQQRSQKFLRSQLENRQSSFSPSHLTSVTLATSHEVSSPIFPNPTSGAATPQPKVFQNPSLITPSTSTAHSSKRVILANPLSLSLLQKEGKNKLSSTANLGEGIIDDGGRLQSVPPDSLSTPVQEKTVENSDPNKRVRALEHVVVDNQGIKRRRLDLTSSADSPRDNLVLRATDVPQNKEWYMGPERISPAQLFYHFSSDENDQSFVMLGSKFPTAQRSFVKKCLNYFYKQQPIKLSSDKANSQWAMIPYSHSTVNDNKEKFFTLYTSKNGLISVTKESIEKWPQLDQSKAPNLDPSAETLKSSDPFSYLIQKYPVGEDSQDVCPLYGDSGSEGEFDEETWQEIQDERDESIQRKPAKLTSLEVDSVIQNCIAEYENSWRGVSLPKEQLKARKLWLEAQKNKWTNQKIKALSRDISLLEHRLGKIQAAIREAEYSTKSELELQCQSMEHTVSNIQRQRWHVSVLERTDCPPKILAVPKPRPVQKAKQKDADEESLHSESDMMSVSSFGDFIDTDNTDFDAPNAVDVRSAVDEPSLVIKNPDIARSHTPSTSDSDDDIISPSGMKRKSKARHPFMGSSSPSPVNPGEEKVTQYIDLTMDSPSADELRIETPPLNPVQSKSLQLETDLKSERNSSISPEPDLGSNVFVEIQNPKPKSSNSKKNRKPANLPDHNDFEKILLVPWDLLEERQDRRRLLAKLIASLPDEERGNMCMSIPQYEPYDLQDLTRRALKLLNKGQEKLPAMDPHDNQIIMRTGSLFISWVNCVHLSTKGISKHQIMKTQNEINGFGDFFKELCIRLMKSGNSKSSRHSSNSEEPHLELADLPHKKRKREVKESQDAKRNQQSAQLRVAQQEKERRKLERRMESMGLSNTDPTRQAVSFGDPIIYLDAHIGQRVKPHQLNGIQFMWRELIQDEQQQGCLLAHTMGLGKTMQVISLLSTISAAASSNDPSINKQVHEAFHRSQTLILCPPSLIENWYEEFLMWAPEESNIGPLRKITTSSTHHEKLQEVLDWDEEGGILIMSYDLFRRWILNAKTSKMEKPLQDDVHEKVKKYLLDGPNIIVADEAHKMKNPASGISRATMQFRSKSRIALTGSPLANNLEDYFTMVNWIAEGYLGDFIQFKANHVEPIEDGLYVDSSYAERRKSLKKLQVLKEILDPKINRADITVLAGSLPLKVEFVITIPLTKLQQTAYDSYVESVLSKKSDVGTAQIWSWMAILGLCCNHPACFRDKLLSRASEAQKLDKRLDEIMPGDEPIAQAGLPDSEQLVSQQEELFATVPDMKAPELSYRAQILDKIVNESIKAGDKVLIFSHSIPTLNYIEHILKASNRNYCRLDGSTPVGSRQAATKRFNSGSDQQVYLISTRAGGLGLNIPGANRVVIFDFSFSPVWEEQAVARAYRLGQQKPVFVYRFIAGGTFEEKMYNKALFKTQLAFRVVDKKNPIRQASKSLGEYLFPAKPVEEQDISEFLGKDPHVLDKIIKSDNGEERVIRKITLTETFQREDNDRLTEEERKDVQQELDIERLRRTDPEAYQRVITERQREEFEKQREALAQSWAAKPMMPYRYQQHQLQGHQHQGSFPAAPLHEPAVGPSGLTLDTNIPPQSGLTSASAPPAMLPNAMADHHLRHSQSEPPLEDNLSHTHTPSRELPAEFNTQTDGTVDSEEDPTNNVDRGRLSEPLEPPKHRSEERSSCKTQ